MLRDDGENIEPLFLVLKHDASGGLKKFSMYTKQTAVITHNSFGYEPECFRQFLSGWCEGACSAMHRHTLNGVKAHTVQCKTHFECCEGTRGVMHRHTLNAMKELTVQCTDIVGSKERL